MLIVTRREEYLNICLVVFNRVLTTLKAQQAASSWQQAVKLPEHNNFNGIGIYAVDSLLGYHGYAGKGVYRNQQSVEIKTFPVN